MSEAATTVASTTPVAPPPVVPPVAAVAPAASTKILGGETATTAAAPAAAVDASKVAPDAAALAATAKAEADKAAAAFEAWKPTLPEGVQVDAAVMGEFKPLLKELGLKPEQAQKLVDFDQKQQAAARSNAEKVRAGWVDELKADKDFGGAKFDASVQEARKAMVFAEAKVPGFKKFLAESGLENQPFLVKAFRAIGAGLAEDAIGAAGAGAADAATDEKALQRAMYPNTKFP